MTLSEIYKQHTELVTVAGVHMAAVIDWQAGKGTPGGSRPGEAVDGPTVHVW